MDEKSKQTKTNAFKEAVDSIDDLKGGYRPGMQALKKTDSDKISVSESRNLLGSVDIDDCTKPLYPNASRWDYAIGYNQRALFIEVHPADTSNIDEMVKKVEWLKNWLNNKGRSLKNIKRDDYFYWIPSGRCRILKTSPQYKRLAINKLSITKHPFVIV